MEEGFDAIDLAGEAEGGLDGGDVGDGEVVIRADEVGRGFEKKSDLEFCLMAGGDGEDGVTGLKVETLGEGAGKGDGVGFGDKGDGIGGGAEGVFEPIGDEFAIREGIDADEVKKFSGMIRERGDELEGGGEFANGGIVSEKGDQFFGKTEALAFDSEVGATGDEIERGAKGAVSGLIDRLDGNDGSDADGKGEETDAPLNESFDVGLFSAEPGKGRFDEDDVLLFERRQIRTGVQTLRFITARKPAFAAWRVDAAMMGAAHPQALFMHCLPAHRGEEVDADVIDGAQSVVWDEAENRMHVQKALMEYLLLGKMSG